MPDRRERAASGAHEPPDGPPALASGTRIGSFEIVDLLGRGGMGEVYQAFDHELRRKVALKLIAEDTRHDPAFVSRFRREAQLASTVIHPNVAQVFAAGDFAGRPYYVLEYVEGESLATRLEGGERLSGRVALGYLLQACRGLEAAWEAGVVHRDIKPSNLMLTTGGVLKIVDFGLARSVAPDGSSSLTEPDLILGTPTYTAPEQALGLEVDHRADIYSLGASFYHLFSGDPVFSGESALGVLVRHVEEIPRPLAEIRPSVPPAVSDLIERMLAKSPEDRWQTYAELIAELEGIQAGGPGAELPSESLPWYRMPIVWGVGALGLVLTLALILGRDETPAIAREPEVTTAPSVASEVLAAIDSVPRPATGPENETSAAAATADLDEFMAQIRSHPLMTVARNAQTLAAMRRLTTAVEIYRAEEGPLPESLEAVRELQGLNPRDLLDAWQSPIELVAGEESYTLRSAGPDRVAGNEDDLVIEDGYVIQGGVPPPS